MGNIDKDSLNAIYATALRIRIVEQAIADRYKHQEMRSPTHLYIGQEAIASAVCQCLTKSDILYGYYRSHGWYLAKGGDLQGMMDELHGRSTGCSKGFGGSMHLIDLSVNFQGTTAIVAGAMPHGVGAAFASVYQKTDRVTVCAFGDGATEEGLFQESLMFAALRKLPLIFICENNGLATNTWIQHRQPAVPIYKRAESFGVHSTIVDGNDATAVFVAAQAAVERARTGQGPSFIECTTCRILEHCGPSYDVSLGVRTTEDIERWRAKDPLLRMEPSIDPALRDELKIKFMREIEQCFERARTAPFPTSLLPEGFVCQR